METWETIGNPNWFCSRSSSWSGATQYPPGSQTAKRSPRRSRHIDMPSLAPCRPKVWIWHVSCHMYLPLMGAIMGAWGQIYEVYDWLCAHVPLLHWEHNYHGGHYRVCSHVITQSWGYSMALARWSSVTHGTQPQIHRDLHGDGINKPHPFMMKLRMVDDWVYHIGNYIPEISQNSKDFRWYDDDDDDDDHHHHHHHHRKYVSCHLLGIPYVSWQKGWSSLTKLHNPLARGSISLYVASKVNRASTKPRKTGIF